MNFAKVNTKTGSTIFEVLRVKIEMKKDGRWKMEGYGSEKVGIYKGTF